jgi:tRNA A-37 threonylcarbamoyl transferase component Bud32
MTRCKATLTMPPTVPDQTAPRELGPYRLVRRVGSGGTATVFQAYDPRQDRSVALKVARTRQATALKRDWTEQLFEHEARVMRLLHHPNIIEVYEAGASGEWRFLAMEYIAGGATLARHCTPQNLLPLELAAGMMLKCAEALDYAHQNGVIHRDIKPGNILLRDDREIKLTDFSIASLDQSGDEDTQVMVPIGSPRYLPPERLRDDPVTAAVDQFSLGLVFYELLTGRYPFEAASLAELSDRILYDEPPPPSRLRAGIPASLDQLVLKMLDKSPPLRFPSMFVLATELAHCFPQLRAPQSWGVTRQRSAQLLALPFFQGFSPAEAGELLRWAEWREWRDGERLLRAESDQPGLLLLISGKAEVQRDGKPFAVLAPGELLCETAFLAPARRGLDARARGSAITLQINHAQLAQSTSACQLRFQHSLIRGLLERAALNQERLSRLGAMVLP